MNKNFYLWICRRSEIALQKIDDTLLDLTEQCSDALVDQRALLAGQAFAQNIDLDPYREKICQEMADKKRKRLQLSKGRQQASSTDSKSDDTTPEIIGNFSKAS